MPRLHRSFAPAILLVAFFAAAPRANAADLTAVIQGALRNFAPVVYLHPEEKYLPTSAEKFLEVTTPTPAGGLRLKDEGASRNGNLAAATAYVNVKVMADFTEAQFWFLYAYN